MEITSKSEWNTWEEVDWKKVTTQIFKLQKRIYRASKDGEWKLVHKLQKMIVGSWYGKLISVRRISQENKGKKTAGIDGVKLLTPTQRLELAKSLDLDGKSKPTRRVWIPKPGKKEMRPLGIPTMEDRAKQALLKLALEPEWEAKFEGNSFGFRPGRSSQDAIKAIKDSIRYKPKYVLDADIAKCFDGINHEVLLNKLKTFPKFKQQIKAWLKAGVVDFSEWAERKGLSETPAGTPQGGVCSPLLANIALHGLENTLKDFIETIPMKSPGGHQLSKSRKRDTLGVIRYADDFVILHEDLNVVHKCKEIVESYLKDLDLELKPSKTRMAHTLNPLGKEKPGFNFLGFHIQQYKKGKHHSGKNPQKELLGFKTIIKPQKEKIQTHYRKIDDWIDKMKACNQAELILKLNPIIRGWCNYQSPWNSSNAYKKMDNLIWNRLWKWGKRRHPRKGKKWIAKKYWNPSTGWKFKTNSGNNPLILFKHSDFKCGKDWIKVKGEKSPFDGEETYWSRRMGDMYTTYDPQKARLLKEQKGKCAHCGISFLPDDHVEKHHIIKKSKGGNNGDKNLMLVHLHCHDQIHQKKMTVQVKALAIN